MSSFWTKNLFVQQNMSSEFRELLDDLLLAVFQHLPREQQLVARILCRRFRGLIDHRSAAAWSLALRVPWGRETRRLEYLPAGLLRTVSALSVKIPELLEHVLSQARFSCLRSLDLSGNGLDASRMVVLAVSSRSYQKTQRGQSLFSYGGIWATCAPPLRGRFF